MWVCKQGLREGRWVQDLHRTGGSALAVRIPLGQKSGVGEMNCTVCYYADFLLLWKALRYCSHLDLGAQSRLGPELVAVQVVIQRVA